MKRMYRFLGVFLSLFALSLVLFSSYAHAAETSMFDTETSSQGYFSVNYNTSSGTKMKVGVTSSGKTVYYTYIPGAKASYTFPNGDGTYTLTLYQNISGTSYRAVGSKSVTVKMEDEFAPYLASTAEITFSAEDGVGKKADALCRGKKNDSAKVVAINNYIAGNFTYDFDFAARVSSGSVKNYIPNTNETLTAKTGICYDFSALFAAMCRSQGIACKVQRGYLNGTYHAWNQVYVNDAWQAVDVTASISKGLSTAKKLADVTFSMNAENGYIV